MTIQELIGNLKKLQEHEDPEIAHYEADNMLLNFIYNKEVTQAFDKIEKWYS